MTSFYDSYEYYKKMLELQEKLRKSEEERIRLEERFKILAQESRNRHDACINRLRLQYIEFLEDQRVRDERNHKLLEALDKVDNSLASMTLKTDRLNVLRNEYEACLRQIYKVPSPSENVVNDRNITKQREDVYIKRDTDMERIDLPTEIKTTSPQDTSPTNVAVNRSISHSLPRHSKSQHRTSIDYYQPSVAQPVPLSQQVNWGPITQRTYTTVPENAQLSTGGASSASFHQKQPYVQIDTNLRVSSFASGSQIRSFGPQATPQWSKASVERTATQTATPSCINSISQYKFLDVPPKRFTPISLQQYAPSSPAVKHFSPDNGKQERMIAQRSLDSTPVHRGRNIFGSFVVNRSVGIQRKSTSPRKPDYTRKSINQSPVHPVTTNVDDTINRHKCFSPKGSGSRGLTVMSETAVDEDEPAATVENELDRYIHKIRKLHCDLDAQSLEEIDEEQKTGNVLYASLPDDNSSFSAVGQAKGNLPEEVERVLALANDLASRTVDSNDANDSGKGCADENRNPELDEAARDDISTLERNRIVLLGMKEERETSTPLAKDRIGDDIKLPEPKVDSFENIKTPWKQNLSEADGFLEQRERHLSETEMHKQDDLDASLNDTVMERKYTGDALENSICIAQELNLPQSSFDVPEELAPWELDVLQKRIREIDLTEEDRNRGEKMIVDKSKLNKDNVDHVEFSGEADNLENQIPVQDLKEDMNMNGASSDNIESPLRHGSSACSEQEETSAKRNEAVLNETSVLHEEVANEDNDTGGETIAKNVESDKHRVDEEDETDNEQAKKGNEDIIQSVTQNDESQIRAEDEEYGHQNYYDDSNQAENYGQNYEGEFAGLSDGYNCEQNAYDSNQDQNYDQNVAYESNQDQTYGQNVAYESNQDQNYDQNVAYETNQEQNYDESAAYEGNRNQEYEEYVQASSEQYGGEQSDSENQYEPDTNKQYQEDPNQQYTYAYDQQYDSNRVDDSSMNQPAEYADYGSNQSKPKEEEKEEEENRLHEEHKELEAGWERQEESRNKLENKNEKVSPEDGTKKKKDVIKSLLDSDTDSIIERNVSNTESDFDFN